MTGGEEDGVNNESVENSLLYTQPEDIWDVQSTLLKVSPNFSIAAGFGNVHGVYKPGNVSLQPDLLGKHQVYVREQLKTDKEHPVFFVFHGGSGSEKKDIDTAVGHGVVKMNVDTDTQFAYLEGIRDFVLNKKDYLLTQVGTRRAPTSPTRSSTTRASGSARVRRPCPSAARSPSPTSAPRASSKCLGRRYTCEKRKSLYVSKLKS